MSRRAVLTIVVSLLLGPFIATAGFIFLGGIVVLILFGAHDAAVLVQFAPVTLMSGYLFGAIPALAGATIVAAFSPWLPVYRTRLLVAGFVGLLSAVPVVGMLLLGGQHFGLAFAVCPASAVAGICCLAMA